MTGLGKAALEILTTPGDLAVLVAAIVLLLSRKRLWAAADRMTARIDADEQRRVQEVWDDITMAQFQRQLAALRTVRDLPVRRVNRGSATRPQTGGRG